MKKLFAVLAIAGFLTACNDDADTTTSGDTTSTTNTTVINNDSLNAGGTVDSLNRDTTVTGRDTTNR